VSSALNAFVSYCTLEGIRPDFFRIRDFERVSLIDKSIENLEIFEGFSTYVVEGRGCNVNTAKQYGKAVRRIISDNTGYDCKYGHDWSRLERTHSGLLKKYPYKKRRRDPVLIQDLRRLVTLLNLRKYTWAMYWAVTMIVFFGVSRKGDHLPDSPRAFSARHHTTVGDVTFVRIPGGDEMFIKMDEHKTSRVSDKFTQKPFVSADPSNPLCPVRAVRSYMRMAGLIDTEDRMIVEATTPLFRLRNNRTLTGRHYLKFVRVAMLHLGKEPEWYGTHSMRIGGATLAMTCPSGNRETVKMMGFWLSNVMDVYVFPSKGIMRTLSREMLAIKETVLAE
jgi:hypothetical protein